MKLRNIGIKYYEIFIELKNKKPFEYPVQSFITTARTKKQAEKILRNFAEKKNIKIWKILEIKKITKKQIKNRRIEEY